MLQVQMQKSFKPVNVSAFQRQRQTQVLSKFNSKQKLNSQSKSESKLQSQKSTLLGEKQTLLDNSPFKKYKNISQYNILSKEKKEKIQKAHQYYLNQIMIHKCLTSTCGSLCWMCSKPCHKPYNKTCLLDTKRSSCRGLESRTQYNHKQSN